MRSPLLCSFLAAFFACLFAGCGDSSQLSDVARIQQAGVLRVGIEPGYLPFEMKTVAGELIGFDVELARAIGESLGVQVEFRETEWDGIIPALKSGDIDLICSGMSITEERKQAVLFSEPYFQVGQALLIKKGSGYSEVQDLNVAGKVITVQTGTTGEKAAREFLPLATIKGFDKQIEAALEVQGGRADALVFDQPFVAIYQRRNADAVDALIEPFTKEAIGIALRPKAADLKAVIDRTVAAMRADGRLAALEQKHFVEMPWLDQIGDE